MLGRTPWIYQVLIWVLFWMVKSDGKLFNIEVHYDDPVCKVDEHFLSIAVGTFHARQQFKAFDFSSQKLKNVVSALRPAYIRLGGSDANFLVFRPGPRKPQPTQPTIATTQATTQETTTVATTTEAQTTTVSTTPKTTTTEEPKTTTTEEPKTTATEETTTTKTTTKKSTTTPEPTTKRPTTTEEITTPEPVTTPRPTQAPTTAMPQWTPATTPPGTTPSQMQLPNVAVDATSSPAGAATDNPWGTKNSEMEKNDSEDDDSADDKKDSQKGDYVEDLKDSLEQPTTGNEAAGSKGTLGTESQPAQSSQVYSAYANQGQTSENSQASALNAGGSDGSTTATEQGLGAFATTGQQQETNQYSGPVAVQNEAQTGTQSAVYADPQQQRLNNARSRNDAFIRATNKQSEAAKRTQMLTTNKRSKHQKYPFWLSAHDFDRFVKFVQNTGLDLIFDINGFFRRPDGSWDATNAMDLLAHVDENDYKISWEMGNEPNRYRKYGKSHMISALQEGLDMIRLRSLLQRNKKYRSKLIGPGVSRPGTGDSEKYLEGFLNIASWAIDAVTWHQYYVSKKTTVAEVTDPKTLDLFRKQIVKVNKVVEKTHARKPVWLGETGSAWGGGAPGISDTFAASFMFLDKLGLAGLYCNQVVIRQSLLGGSYALLDDNFTPRPDYWVGLIHKKLVGRKVFRVSGGSRYVRVYAHCTRDRAGYPKGAITIIAMNVMKKSKAQIKFKGLKQSYVDQYLIAPSNGRIRSKDVDLNGEELRLKDGMYVPKLHPMQKKTPLTLPPMTLGFYVIPFAGVPFCV